MPNKYTKLTHQITIDGKTHEVSQDNIQQYGWQTYADDYPNATVRMRDKDGADWDVPITDVEAAIADGLHAFTTGHYEKASVEPMVDVTAPSTGAKPSADTTGATVAKEEPAVNAAPDSSGPKDEFEVTAENKGKSAAEVRRETAQRLFDVGPDRQIQAPQLGMDMSGQTRAGGQYGMQMNVRPEMGVTGEVPAEERANMRDTEQEGIMDDIGAARGATIGARAMAEGLRKERERQEEERLRAQMGDEAYEEYAGLRNAIHEGREEEQFPTTYGDMQEQIERSIQQMDEDFVHQETLGGIGAGYDIYKGRKLQNTAEDAALWRNLQIRRRLLDNAWESFSLGQEERDDRDRVDTGLWSFTKSTGRKLFDPKTWTFGALDADEAIAISEAADAFDRGEATEEQIALLDAATMSMMSEGYKAAYAGHGMKAGEVTGEMAPFILEMMINPIASVGSGAAKKVAQYTLKKFAGQIAKGGARRVAARTAARVAALGTTFSLSIPKGAGMALTTGLPSVIGDYYSRRTGDLLPEYDNGEVSYSGREDREDVGEAIKDAILSQTYERSTELSGSVLLSPVSALAKKGIAGAGKLIANGISRTPLRGVMDWMGRMTPTRLMQTISDIEKKAQWHGTLDEYFEEVENNIENALTVGDMDFGTGEKGVFNLEQNIDTFLGVAALGGTVSFIKTASGGYRAIRGAAYQAKADLKDADAVGRGVFGDGWAAIRNTVTGASLDDLAKTLAGLMWKGELTPEQSQALLSYARAQVRLDAVQAAGQSMSSEDPVLNTEQTAFEEGETMPIEDCYGAAQEYLAAEQAVMNMGLGALVQQRDQMSDGEWQQVVNGLNAEESAAVTAYETARARIDGVLARAREGADDATRMREVAVQMATQQVKQENGVPAAQLTIGAVDGKEVFVLGNTGTMAVVIDPETLEKQTVPSNTITNWQFVNPTEYVNGMKSAAQAEAEGAADRALSHRVESEEPRDGLVIRTHNGDGSESGAMVMRQEGDGWLVQPAKKNAQGDWEAQGTETPVVMTREEILDAQDAWYNGVVVPEEGEQNGGEEKPETGEVVQSGGEAPGTVTGDEPAAGAKGAVAGEEPAANATGAVAEGAGAEAAAEGAGGETGEGAGAMPEVPLTDEGEVDWSRMTAQEAHDFLADEGRSGYVGSEVDDAIRLNLEEANKALEKENTKKYKVTGKPMKDRQARAEWLARRDAAQKAVDYWEEVAELRRKSEGQRKKREGLDAVEDAELNAEEQELVERATGVSPDAIRRLSEREPETLKELIADLLRGVKLQRNDEVVDGGAVHPGLKSETGWSDRDLQKFNFLLASRENGGITLDAFADLVREHARQLGIRFEDETGTEVKNAILELLQEVDGQKGVNGYIRGRRIAEAKEILRRDEEAKAEYEAEEAARANMRGTQQGGNDAGQVVMAAEGEMPFEAPSAEDEAAMEASVEEQAEGREAAKQEGEEEREEEKRSFNRIFTQFKNKAKAAIRFLLTAKEGRAVGALHHKDVGDIDIWYGNDRAGLKKIAEKHPEVIDNLQELLDGMKVTKYSDNRIILESATHKAIVSKDWYGEPVDNWLLTAYEKKDGASGGSIDIVPEPEGKQNGTAPLQDAEGKGSEVSGNEQENGGEINEDSQMEGGLPAGEAPGTVAGEGTGNVLVTDEEYEELRRRLKAKFGQMNAGIDPETAVLVDEMMVYHIERGARKLVEVAKKLVDDFGDAVRPYLRSSYEWARAKIEDEGASTDGMTPYEEARDFDAANFDKTAPDVLDTANVVAGERELASAERNEKPQETEKRDSYRVGEHVVLDEDGKVYRVEYITTEGEVIPGQPSSYTTYYHLEGKLSGKYTADQLSGIKRGSKKQEEIVKEIQNIAQRGGKGKKNGVTSQAQEPDLFSQAAEAGAGGDRAAEPRGTVTAEGAEGDRAAEPRGTVTAEGAGASAEGQKASRGNGEAPTVAEIEEDNPEAQRLEALRKELFDKLTKEEQAQWEFVTAVQSAMLGALQTGERPYTGIRDLRKAARDAGMYVDEGGSTDILLQELAENGLVRAARLVMASRKYDGRKEKFDAIKKLYALQPTFGQRSSEKVRLQQYSTPLPMAFVADMWAYRPGMTRVLEPTAGNGMLVIGVPSKAVHANEIDATRRKNLKEMGFGEVTGQDATKGFASSEAGGRRYDAMIANPPFGSAEEKEYDGVMISGLDPQITLEALDAMKDNGRAAIIIGGNMEYSSNGAIKNKRDFFCYLYDHYNVAAVLDMDGDLYAKQGTKYPTRMILINGRRSEEERAQTTVFPPVQDNAPKKVTTFDELYDAVNGLLTSNKKTNGNEILRTQSLPLPDDAGGQGGAGSRMAQSDANGSDGRGGRERQGSVEDAGRSGRGAVGGTGQESNGPREQPGVSGLSSTEGPDAGVRPEADNGGVSGRGGRGTSDRGGSRGDHVGEAGRVLSGGLSGVGAARSGVGLEAAAAEGKGDHAAKPRGTVTAERAGASAETGAGDRAAKPRGTVTAEGATGARSEGTAESQPRKRELGEEKMAYRPHNSAFSLESVAPAAMVEAMDEQLKKIEKEEGDIDEFVTRELGYESVDEMHKALAAEQVDSVAMAIYQMKRGQAMIIGDQTGVGKGRQMAALIRWAVRQGKKPVFVTQKADLFSDIYRDLVDVGSGDLRPFIFNSDGAMVDSNGETAHKPLGDKEQKEVMDSVINGSTDADKALDKYDFFVLTYSQVNKGDAQSRKEAEEAAKESGKRRKKKESESAENPRKAVFLRIIAKDNYMFLDESHTAAGESNSGYYLQSLVRNAKAATFASATFAKRPDTMPLYALRTAMSKAKLKAGELIGIIQKGGVTLQEIMSRALTAAGQMVRRERDMTGVRTDWKTIDDPATVKRSRENYDKTIEAFNAIIQFQEEYVEPEIERISKALAAQAASAGVTQGTKKLGVENTPFASKTYNYTKQLLLALKVQAIVDEVVKEIQAGRHPVIALESTMESAYEGYNAGDVIGEPTFAMSLLKGLDSVMSYTVKKGNGKGKGNTVKYPITPDMLGPAGEAAYYELREKIQEMTSDVFISPLDMIIEELRDRGFRVGEMTGRDTYIERQGDGTAVVRKRKDKDKKKMQRDFNSGHLDVLILNKSASTGISLHASEKFSDRRQRSMIIAQPLSDINDYMQMIGRIDRTGQVHRGYYINLGLPVPAEQRFLMMLSTKLKSLNANTTTSQDSETNEVEAPDLLNKYGSQVVVEYLRDNPEVYEKMGAPLKSGSERVPAEKLEGYQPQEDDARRVTGAVALLPTELQEEFYSDVIRRYNELIQYLNETGDNDLKITVLPLRAETLEKRVSSEGSDSRSDNPFARDAYVERVTMDVLKKPMKADEVRKLIVSLNQEKGGERMKVPFPTAAQERAYRGTPRIEEIVAQLEHEYQSKVDAEDARYAAAEAKMREQVSKFREKTMKNEKMSAEEKQAAIEKYEEERASALNATHETNLKRLRETRDSILRDIRRFSVAQPYLIPDDLSSSTFDFYSPGVFCGFKVKDSGITPSTTYAVFATLDGRRKVEIKLSQPGVLARIETQTQQNYDAAQRITPENWDSQIPTSRRKEGYILTGNILQAIADSQDSEGGFQGHLVSYTDTEGNVHDGVLMPEKWTPNQLRSSGVPINARYEEIRGGKAVKSVDGKVVVGVDSRRDSGSKIWFELVVPKSKKEGARFYENDEILRFIEGRSFFQRGSMFHGQVHVSDLKALLDVLGGMGVRVKESADRAAEPRGTVTGEEMRYRGEGTMTEGDRVAEPRDTVTGEEMRYRKVDDTAEIERLENAPKVKRYRAMALIDGKLYPPMSVFVDGAMREPTEIGQWERSDETEFDFTEEQMAAMAALDAKKGKGQVIIIPGKLRYYKNSENGKGTLQFRLKKDNGSDIWAAYNPYFRTSTRGMNDQFTSAWNRPNLVVVEVEVPEEETTPVYQAPYAKDSTGNLNWHSGSVNSALPSDRQRTVTLSRYAKVTRVVPVEEVAEGIRDQLSGLDMEVPFNVVSPSLRDALSERGVRIGAPERGNAGKAAQPAYEEWRAARMSRMRAAGEAVAQRLGLKVEFRDGTEGERVPRTRKGAFGTKSGRIIIYLQNNENEADVVATLLHEGVAHYGLRKLFGKDFDTFLKNVFDNVSPEVRERILALAEKNGWDIDEATEEYLASLAEDTNFEEAQKQGWWQKIREFLVDLLRKAGVRFTGTLTDGDLRYLLWRSYQNLKEGGPQQDAFQMAEDVVQREKLLESRGFTPVWVPKDEYAKISQIIASYPNKTERGLVFTANNFYLCTGIDGDGNFTVLEAMPIEGNEDIINEIRKEYSGGRLIAVRDTKSFDSLLSRLRDERRRDRGGSPVSEGLRERAERDASVSARRQADTAGDTGEVGGDTAQETFRFRDGGSTIDTWDRAVAAERYDRRVASASFQVQEAIQDSMLGLKELMRSVLEAEGKGRVNVEDIAGFENPYLLENALSSRNKAEQDAYDRQYVLPLLDMVSELAPTRSEYAQFEDYLMAKHGLERNRVMNARERERIRKELGDDAADSYEDRDLAGLTGLTTTESDLANDHRTLFEVTADAGQIVADYESSHDMTDIDELWTLINAATKASLQKMYDSGMMDEETYQEIRDMYEYYVPLRGWSETTAGEVYEYLTPGGGAYTDPLQRAKGRKSKADSPLAYIISMGNSAIAMGNRNLMQQAFLNFAERHPSDAISVRSLWLTYDDATDSWSPVFPDIDDSDSPADVARKMEAFEADMEQKSKNDPGHVRRFGEKDKIPYKITSARQKSRHHVIVRRGGRTYVVTVNGNPRAALGLNGLTNPTQADKNVIRSIINAAEAVNRVLSALYTSWRPDFVARNFMRDRIYTRSMVFAKEGKKYGERYNINLLRVNPLTMGQLLDLFESGALDQSNPLHRAFEAFMLNGGETGYANWQGTDVAAKRIEKELAKRNGGTLARVKAGVALTLARVNQINRQIELAPRFAAFLTSREMGRSVTRSIADAKDISVNFNKKGAGDTFFGATGQTAAGNAAAAVSGIGRLGYLFWNPAVQGMTNFCRVTKRDPRAGAIACGALFALGLLQAALLSALGDDDDDLKYQTLPPYIRRSNLLLPIPGKGWISGALPIEYQGLFGLGELAYNICSGREKMDSNELTLEVMSLLSSTLPVNLMEGIRPSSDESIWSQVLSNLTPDLIQPLVDVYARNRTWYGSPVTKEIPNYSSERFWPSYRHAKDRTSKLLVNLSKEINELTGGDDVSKGWWDMNPDRTEYLLDQYLGGAASTLLRTYDVLAAATNMGVAKIKGEKSPKPLPVNNIPIMRTLLQQGGEVARAKSSQSEFFKMKAESEEVLQRYKDYNKLANSDKADTLLYRKKRDELENSLEYARAVLFSELNKSTKGLLDERKQAKDSGNDELLDSINMQLTLLDMIIVDSVNALRKEDLKVEKK